MTWSQRRQFLYISSFFFVVAVVAFILIRNATHVEPTCFDRRKNADEVGVDCGGRCVFYCKNELAAPTVRWERFFEVTPGIVHAVAYIEHSYPTAAVKEVPYVFKLYDAKNNIVTERTGTTYIGPMGRSAIVETLIPVGNIAPAIARFSFTGDIVWEKIPVSFSQIVIKTDRYVLEADGNLTRLTATLENLSRTAFSDMEVVAILYDKNDNAIAVSKALLKQLPSQGTKIVYFTWPDAKLKKETMRVEVLPRTNPFKAQ